MYVRFKAEIYRIQRAVNDSVMLEVVESDEPEDSEYWTPPTEYYVQWMVRSQEDADFDRLEEEARE